jgi:hypothetical protein
MQQPDAFHRWQDLPWKRGHKGALALRTRKARFVALTRNFREKSRGCRRTRQRPRPPLSFHRHPLGKSFLDDINLGTRNPLFGRGQGNCLIVVRFELPDLFALLKIRGD